jgi:predicted NBD/HSP70 family sugar kinase
VAQVARGLGQVLANLVNLLNPQVIILGGSLARVFSARGEDVLSELDAQAMTAARTMVDVRLPALGDDSSLFGAAELTFQRLLADPLLDTAR